MATDYSVVKTEPWTYIDATNKPIQGYRVTYLLPAFNEYHYLFEPVLNPDKIAVDLKAALDARKKLAAL
jgi:hypothetical protein